MSHPWHFYLMAVLYIGAGIMHFVHPKMYMRILPSYLPGHKALVNLSGLAEIILGVALFFPVSKELAIYGIMAMLLFFIPVHIHMLFDKRAALGLSKWALILRIPLQFALMYWAFAYVSL